MAPIRVGIIGLSAKGTTLGPGAWASIALLPTFQSNPAFEIVALCNSSIEAAKRSVEWHKLPASTKVYGDVELLAQDPDVDLVVVSVQVGQHLKVTLPALHNKKNVFVEWPLGASTKEAEEMTELAEANNLKTIVGVQARGNPVISKAKEIIDSGEIGEITSTSVVALYPALLVSGFWFEGVEYYIDIKSGGNSFHITFAHFLDSFTNILGDFNHENFSSILKADVTELEIRKSDLKTVVHPSWPKTAPDHILVQGTLARGNVPASIAFHINGKPTEDSGLRWVISGTKGEVEITSGKDQWQIASSDKKLRVRLYESGEVRDYDFNSVEHGIASGIPDSAVNTALILDAFARGDTSGFADFAGALKQHRLLDEILKKSGYLA